MSALAKKCRGEMEAKARRLAGEKDSKTDSSNWSPAKPLNTEKKTGLQPLGERMARKSGGRVEGEKAVVDAYVNRDVKAANAKAEGKPHEGGYKKGGWIKDAIKKPGALHKSLGVKEGEKIPEKKLEKAEHSKNKLTAKRARLAETLKGMAKGEKTAKACGGSTGPGGKPLTNGRRMNFPGENGSTGPGGKGAEDRVARASGGSTGKGGTITMLNGRRRMYQGQNGTSGPAFPSDKTSEASERTARATGGRTKGKTDIRINILAGQKPPMDGAVPSPAMMPAPGLNPMPVPPPAPAPAAPPPALPIPNSPMPMGRKAGGRVYRSYKDMDAGAASGDGRLEKTEIQEKKRRA